VSCRTFNIVPGSRSKYSTFVSPHLQQSFDKQQPITSVSFDWITTNHPSTTFDLAFLPFVASIAATSPLIQAMAALLKVSGRLVELTWSTQEAL
jgi:hypothetical protein